MIKIITNTLFCLFLMVSCATEENTNLQEDMVSSKKEVIEEETIEEETSEETIEDPLVKQGWTLVLEDEFDTKNLNNWDVWEGGAFNQEVQLYRKEQLQLNNGVLTIKAKRMAITGAKDKFTPTISKNFSYVSGRIESKVPFGPSDKEGERVYRIVSRIKLPKGHGMWSAFWTYKDPWPTLGEIDILEARGNSPRVFQSNIFYGPTAGKSNVKQSETKKTYRLTQDLTADFHEYELIWQKSGIEINVDGKTVGSYTASTLNGLSSFYGKKQHIVLNLAVGGVFFADKNVTGYADAAEMQVDWVKVYKK